MNKQSVFIASTKESLDIAKHIQSYVSRFANSTLWTEGIYSPGISTAASLSKEAEKSDLAVFIMSPDDFSINRTGTLQLSKENFLFELGVFFGRLGSSRIIVAIPEGMKSPIPSDLTGLMCHYIKSSRGISEYEKLSLLIEKTLAQLITKDVSNKLDKDVSAPFYSCFISYSIKDKVFVNSLYQDLIEIGVPCWLDSMEMRVGDDLNSSIRRSIQEQDKVILILSQNSIESKWVNKELSASLELERKRGKTVLFPIRIDDTIFSSFQHDSLMQIKERHIGDFTNWHDEKMYKKSFSRMVRDLMTTSSVESLCEMFFLGTKRRIRPALRKKQKELKHR